MGCYAFEIIVPRLYLGRTRPFDIGYRPGTGRF